MNKEEILSVISEFGWYPGRRINTESFILDYAKRSYSVPNERMTKLFEEFWNIGIYYTASDGYEMDIHLNVDEALYLTLPQIAGNIELIIGDHALPVGTMMCDGYVVWMTSNGKFYCSSEGIVYYIAAGFFEFLNVMFERDEFKEVGTYRQSW